MRLALPLLFVFSFLFTDLGELSAASQSQVTGVITDVQDARVAGARLTFTSGVHEFTTQSAADGTYSIYLPPATYFLTLRSRYFCTIRRAAFELHKGSLLRFNFQMWVSPSDMELIRYEELASVPKTKLRPLVLFGESEQRNDSTRFVGAPTYNDGTGHSRNYPVVLTFNLLTVQGDEMLYYPSQHLLIVRGNVRWQNDDTSGQADAVTIDLNAPNPTPIPPKLS